MTLSRLREALREASQDYDLLMQKTLAAADEIVRLRSENKRLRSAARLLIDKYRAPRTPDDTPCRLNDVGDYCLEHEAEFHQTLESCPVAAARSALQGEQP